jgi:hypothetical protein
VVTDTDSSRAISGAHRFVGRYRSTRISLRLNGSISTQERVTRVGRPWYPPRMGRLPVSHFPRAHARLETVGAVLGQLQPPPPAANASATRIYPRSRSWPQGVGSPGIDAHQAWPGDG